VTRIYVKWFGEREAWTDTTRNEFVSLLNASKDIKIVQNETDADVIIVYNKHLTQKRQFETRLIASTYFRENASRLLIYDECDNPTFIFPGLYVSTDVRNVDSHVLPIPYFHSRLPIDFNIQEGNRSILCSFWGRNSHPIRNSLYGINVPRYSIIDTSPFDFFDMSESNQVSLITQRERYISSLQSSMYSICPRGYGSCSIRLFESLLCGCVPIIISDHYVTPKLLDWNIASIRVSECDVSNIVTIVSDDSDSYAERAKYIKEIAVSSLLPQSVCSYIAASMPDINTFNTFQRYIRSLTHRSLRKVSLKSITQ